MDRNTLIETLMGMRIQLRASGDLRYADFPTPDFAAQIADALLLLWNEEKELATKESAAALVEANKQIENLRVMLADLLNLHPADTWSEDDGDVLWWCLPIEEPPYCGTPLDMAFPRYATHWSRVPKVNEKGEDFDSTDFD